MEILEKDYIFKGGIKGPHKNGSGQLIFNDGCVKNVEYIDDKIAFQGLKKVFNFVSDFTCYNHKEI